jgi:hypothetical protein
VTVAQVREIFMRLLRNPLPSSKQIATEVNRVLRRNEEARIYHWHEQTNEFPPRRTMLSSARGPPEEKGLQ